MPKYTVRLGAIQARCDAPQLHFKGRREVVGLLRATSAPSCVQEIIIRTSPASRHNETVNWSSIYEELFLQKRGEGTKGCFVSLSIRIIIILG